MEIEKRLEEKMNWDENYDRGREGEEREMIHEGRIWIEIILIHGCNQGSTTGWNERRSGDRMEIISNMKSFEDRGSRRMNDRLK